LSQTDDIDSKLQVVKLNSQDLSHFDCTDKGEDAQGLQIFIQKEAREYQQRDLGVTYLSLLGNIIAGFLTVAMSSVDVERMERGESDGRTVRYLSSADDWQTGSRPTVSEERYR
jgi:hypothetical protein